MSANLLAENLSSGESKRSSEATQLPVESKSSNEATQLLASDNHHGLVLGLQEAADLHSAQNAVVHSNSIVISQPSNPLETKSSAEMVAVASARPRSGVYFHNVKTDKNISPEVTTLCYQLDIDLTTDCCATNQPLKFAESLHSIREILLNNKQITELAILTRGDQKTAPQHWLKELRSWDDLLLKCLTGTSVVKLSLSCIYPEMVSRLIPLFNNLSKPGTGITALDLHNIPFQVLLPSYSIDLKLSSRAGCVETCTDQSCKIFVWSCLPCALLCLLGNCNPNRLGKEIRLSALISADAFKQLQAADQKVFSELLRSLAGFRELTISNEGFKRLRNSLFGAMAELYPEHGLPVDSMIEVWKSANFEKLQLGSLGMFLASKASQITVLNFLLGELPLLTDLNLGGIFWMGITNLSHFVQSAWTVEDCAQFTRNLSNSNLKKLVGLDLRGTTIAFRLELLKLLITRLKNLKELQASNCHLFDQFGEGEGAIQGATRFECYTLGLMVARSKIEKLFIFSGLMGREYSPYVLRLEEFARGFAGSTTVVEISSEIFDMHLNPWFPDQPSQDLKDRFKKAKENIETVLYENRCYPVAKEGLIEVGYDKLSAVPVILSYAYRSRGRDIVDGEYSETLPSERADQSERAQERVLV